VLVERALEGLRANNIADIEDLNRRLDGLQEGVLDLVRLHNQISTDKTVPFVQSSAFQLNIT